MIILLISQMVNKEVSKTIPPQEVVKLWVRAGGRCEFNGCNEYLLKDSLTLEKANFSNIAHIVARTLGGPRGDDPLPIKQINKVENLMLACTKHHKLIDTKDLVKKYPKELLQAYKRDHEDRIFLLTQTQPGNKTFIIRLKAKIAGEIVEIPLDQIKKAVHPRYPQDVDGLEIDLTGLPNEENDSWWVIAQKRLDEQISSIYAPGVEKKVIEHISVFPLGPIPLLMYIGNKLSNKVTADLFQRHRDTEDWEWKKEEAKAKYKIDILGEGTGNSKVALLLSLSGPISKESLPDDIQKDFRIYEITLAEGTPTTGFLRTKEDLAAFLMVYHQAIGLIMKDNPPAKEIHFFPAIPAPIAVMCGRELLKKVHPSLKVYDFNKRKGGFSQILTIN